MCSLSGVAVARKNWRLVKDRLTSSTISVWTALSVATVFHCVVLSSLCNRAPPGYQGSCFVLTVLFSGVSFWAKTRRTHSAHLQCHFDFTRKPISARGIHSTHWKKPLLKGEHLQFHTQKKRHMDWSPYELLLVYGLVSMWNATHTLSEQNTVDSR